MTAHGRLRITGFCNAGDVFDLESGDEHLFCVESVDGAGVWVLRPNDEGRACQRLLGWPFDASRACRDT